MNDHVSKTVLVTGGSGFAGSHLIEHLLSQGYTDIHSTSYSQDAGYVADLLPADHLHQIDLTDFELTQELLQKIKPQEIYHLAALSAVGSSFEQATKVYVNNFKLQFNLLESIRLHSPHTRILAVGSAQEYDCIGSGLDSNTPIAESHPLGPANPYGVSKVDQDLLALSYQYAYNLDVVRVRPFNHIGERQELGFAVPDFAHQITMIEAGQQDKISVGNLNAVRDFTDVKDIVRGYEVVMQSAPAGRVYNIGSGTGITIQKILDSMISLSKADIIVEIAQDKFRPIDVPSIIADTTSITELGWYPKISIQESLSRIIEYWRKRL